MQGKKIVIGLGKCQDRLRCLRTNVLRSDIRVIELQADESPEGTEETEVIIHAAQVNVSARKKESKELRRASHWINKPKGVLPTSGSSRAKSSVYQLRHLVYNSLTWPKAV